MDYTVHCSFQTSKYQPKLFGFIKVGKPITTTQLVKIEITSEEGQQWECHAIPMDGVVKDETATFKVSTPLPMFINDKLEKDFMETAHASLSTLIPHVFSKFKKNEDGSYTVPAPKAERWLKRATKSYDELDDKELRVPYREAEKYMEACRNHEQSLIK